MNLPDGSQVRPMAGNTSRPWRGWWRHLLLTLQLNVRSRQALVYGYAVPVLFLLAFGGIFRGDTPLLWNEMGQLLTISILGGACFGLPTALVAERERGVWRRYRLLPVPTASLVLGTLAARILIVASAVALQMILARLIYGTPLPLHPLQTFAGFGVVVASFLGLGLLIAALADDVPAVQALGQCLFLPMIMIGGVGVPLIVLPGWAQRIAGFMPGKYAVDILQRGYSEAGGLRGAGFDFVALGIIGVAAAIVGARRFRWEVGGRSGRRGMAGVSVALAAWAAVGLSALATGNSEPILPEGSAYADITAAQIDSIRYDDLPGDNELATRLAPPFSRPPAGRVQDIAAWLKKWPPSQTGNVVDDSRHLLSVAAIADIGADLNEAEIARVVFDELQARYGHAQLRKILGWIVLHPNAGTVITQAPELNLRRGNPSEQMVRERVVLYGKKFLGRLVGKIAD